MPLRFVCTCCLLVMLGGPVAEASRGVSQLGSLDAGVLVELNLVRAAHQLAPLRLNDGLEKAATMHSTEMATDGYFAHRSSGGASFWKRLAAFYPQGAAQSWSVGENLLWTSDPLDAQRAVATWMASPEHRAILLNPAWREVGISSVGELAAPGTYRGLNVTVLTADFGVRQ